MFVAKNYTVGIALDGRVKKKIKAKEKQHTSLLRLIIHSNIFGYRAAGGFFFCTTNMDSISVNKINKLSDSIS